MKEYDLSTLDGITQFQSDHEAILQNEIAKLDNLLHEHPDNLTIKLVARYKLLEKLHGQTVSIINGLLDKATD